MNVASSLSHTETALARHHTLQLLAGLFTDGVTSSNLPYLRALPALAAGVPPAGPDVSDQLVEQAADHHELFQFNVFPFASLFMGSDGLAGGAAAEEARARYAVYGYAPDLDQMPDHLGQQLAALAYLNGQLAGAYRAGRADQVAAVAVWQAELLHEGLLPWAVPCLLAIRRHGPPLYAAAAELALELLADLATEFVAGDARPAAFLEAPDLLEAADSRLRDIASWLLTPAYSGFYLARADILRLGRAYNLPRGFGSRSQMLTNLLRAAAQYEQWPLLLAALGELAHDWEGAYAKTEMDSPALAPYLDQWLAQLVATERLLVGLAAGAAGLIDEAPVDS